MSGSSSRVDQTEFPHSVANVIDQSLIFRNYTAGGVHWATGQEIFQLTTVSRAGGRVAMEGETLRKVLSEKWVEGVYLGLRIFLTVERNRSRLPRHRGSARPAYMKR